VADELFVGFAIFDSSPLFFVCFPRLSLAMFLFLFQFVLSGGGRSGDADGSHIYVRLDRLISVI
jgi:hypothetical protein